MSILRKLTFSQLKENKQRTFLTGLSIAIIVSLLTAIIIFVTSLWSFGYNQIVAGGGEWHFRTNVISTNAKEQLEKTNFVKSTSDLSVGTISLTENSEPVYIYGAESVREFQAIEIKDEQTALYSKNLYSVVEGRLPQKPDEIFVSVPAEELLSKNLVFEIDGKEQVFKVVGIGHNRLDYDVPFVLFYQTDFNFNKHLVFIQSSNLTNDIFQIMKNYEKKTNDEVQFEKNTSLLLFNFVTDQLDAYSGALTILITVITIVSIIAITVISSSFMLSLNERLKQLGALSSVGTTRKQIRQMMLLEAVSIGVVSIIIGVIIGIIGMSITIPIVSDLSLEGNLLENSQVPFTLAINWYSILCVVCFTFIIVLLASIVPTVRASRRAPIDNIKQVPFQSLFKFKKKTQKTKSKKLGSAYYLAKRYQSHNKSRSRTVFFILTISLSTFIILSNVLTSTQAGIEQRISPVTKGTAYDRADMILMGTTRFLKPNSNSQNQATIMADEDKVIAELSTFLSENNAVKEFYVEKKVYVDDRLPRNIIDKIKTDAYYSYQVVALSPKQEEELLRVANVSPAEFKQKGIVVAYDKKVMTEHNKYTLETVKAGMLANESFVLTYPRSEDNPNGDRKETVTVATNISGNELSFGLSGEFNLVVSHDMYNQLYRHDTIATFILNIDTTKNLELEKQIKEQFVGVYVNNISLNMKQIRNLLMIIQILIYGFLSLIAIVCLTTLFNTLSTHIRLRRREFAILKSIGMTTKQLKLMLSIENLKSGVISVIIGSVLSFLITYYVHLQTAGAFVGAEFTYPILPTIVSSTILLVILMCFNLFSIRETLKRSLVEDIKQEII